MSQYWIQTRSGKAFDLMDPTSAMVCMGDISYALSNLCRYNGHSRYFYSVAEHSFRVSSHLPKALKLQGLMHDAAEAYTGDLVAPIKYMPQFREPWSYMEDRIWRVIADKYGIAFELDPLVRDADLRMLETEKRDLGFLPMAKPWIETGLKPYPDTITAFEDNDNARLVFLSRFRELYRGPEP